MITGERLYEIAFGKDAFITWASQGPAVKDAFINAAAVLHQQEIQPLQQLVRDWQIYVQADDELVAGAPNFHAELDVLNAERKELEQRTKAMLGGEEP